MNVASLIYFEAIRLGHQTKTLSNYYWDFRLQYHVMKLYLYVSLIIKLPFYIFLDQFTT